MSSHAMRWLALSGCAFSLALVVLGLFLGAANRSVENEIEPYTVNLVVAALAFSLVGAIVAVRQRKNPIGWLLLGVGILYATELFMGNYAVYTLDTDPGSLPGGPLAAWLTSWVWIAGGSLVLFVFLYFPDGRLPSSRWRPVAWFVLINAALAVAPFAFAPGLVEGLSGGSRIVNPVGIEGSTKLLDLFERASFVLLVPVSVALILSFVVRFRRARGDERQQIKLVAYGVALFTLAILVVSIWPSIDRSVVGNVLFLVGFLAIPSAIALAILKYRLFNIDVVINRTLVYAVLTAALGIVYFGGVAALQLVTRPIPGDQSQLVVVISTLAIAALFNPLRRRTQSVIDRRFYRRKYDAARTLEAFSARLRNDRDLGQLSAGLLSAVRETMEPTHVSLWLPPERAPRSGTGGR